MARRRTSKPPCGQCPIAHWLHTTENVLCARAITLCCHRTLSISDTAVSEKVVFQSCGEECAVLNRIKPLVVSSNIGETHRLPCVCVGRAPALGRFAATGSPPLVPERAHGAAGLHGST